MFPIESRRSLNQFCFVLFRTSLQHRITNRAHLWISAIHHRQQRERAIVKKIYFSSFQVLNLSDRAFKSIIIPHKSVHTHKWLSYLYLSRPVGARVSIKPFLTSKRSERQSQQIIARESSFNLVFPFPLWEMLQRVKVFCRAWNL